MNRRKFLSSMAVKAAAGAVAGIAAGCSSGQTPATGELAAAAQADRALPELNWQCATSWPMGLDTLFGSVTDFAERVSAMSGGRFQIVPRAAGELAPGTQVLDVVQEGAVECGHTTAYYYVGKSPVMAFGTALPFGLNAQQQNAWLYEGDGLALLQECYAEKFNVIQFPAGNTGAQMGGWFRKEINTVADLRGLKMRIAGLGGQVMDRLGVTVQVLPGGDIFQALQTGAIDAAEWVGPYDDEKLGLNKVAAYYYYPGWWEPCGAVELEINLDRWNELPEIYQAIIRTAARDANLSMLARYDARNSLALDRLIESGTQLRSYSDEILAAAQDAALALFDEYAAADADFAHIYSEWSAFRQHISRWHTINQGSFTRFMDAQI